MEGFIFYHETQKCLSLDSLKGSKQEIVRQLADYLCQNNIVNIGGKYYTHISLPEFLHDMASLPNVRLDDLYTHFQKELSDCLLQQINNLQIGAQLIQNNGI